MTNENGGSIFNPDNFSSGGFFDDVDAVIVNAIVGTKSILPFTPDEDACYIGVTFRPDDTDVAEGTQYYKVGSLEKFTPSTDGTRVVSQPGAKTNSKAKASEFMASLINCGFPKKDLPSDNSVKFLIGLHVHLNAIEREFKEGKGAQAEKYSVVLVTKLHGKKDVAAAGAPAKPQAAKPRAAAKPAAAAAPAQAAPVTNGAAETTPADDVEGIVQATILGLLAANGNTVNRRTLPTAMMKEITDPAVRPAAFKLVGSNEWLGREGQPWNYDAASQDLTSL